MNTAEKNRKRVQSHTGRRAKKKRRREIEQLKSQVRWLKRKVMEKEKKASGQLYCRRCGDAMKRARAGHWYCLRCYKDHQEQYEKAKVVDIEKVKASRPHSDGTYYYNHKHA